MQVKYGFNQNQDVQNRVKVSNSLRRFVIAPRVTRVSAVNPIPSQQYDAKTLPYKMARRRLASTGPSAVDKYPIMPPTKQSPAPVGSTTCSRGKAGATNSLFRAERMAPCSPFLIMTYL